MTAVPSSEADASAARLLGPEDRGLIDLLHVGSTIPRKRIDVLIKTFAAVQLEFPNTRLVRIGGDFTASQSALLRESAIDPAKVLVVPYMKQDALAAIYRRAALVLQPSDAEGFGLPVAEAMACGVPIVASDLDVLREVGGAGAEYCAVGDIASWSGTVCAMLRERQGNSERWEQRRQTALRQATQFTWARFAEGMVSLYHQAAETPPVRASAAPAPSALGSSTRS